MKSKPQQDLDEVRALASEDDGLLFEMKKAGQQQEFKQLIVAMASVLNTEVQFLVKQQNKFSLRLNEKHGYYIVTNNVL